MSVPLDDVARFLDDGIGVTGCDEPESNELIVRSNDTMSRAAAAVSPRHSTRSMRRDILALIAEPQDAR